MTARDVWRWTDERGVQRLVGTDELRSALAGSVLPPSTLVWREGMKEWAPASTVPELASAAFAAVPATAAGAAAASAGDRHLVRPRAEGDEDSFDVRSTLKDAERRATLIGLLPHGADPRGGAKAAVAEGDGVPPSHPLVVPSPGNPAPAPAARAGVTQIPPFGAPIVEPVKPGAPRAPVLDRAPRAADNGAGPRRKITTTDIDSLWAPTEDDETIPRRALPSELAAAAAASAEATAAQRDARLRPKVEIDVSKAAGRPGMRLPLPDRSGRKPAPPPRPSAEVRAAEERAARLDDAAKRETVPSKTPTPRAPPVASNASVSSGALARPLPRAPIKTLSGTAAPSAPSVARPPVPPARPAPVVNGSLGVPAKPVVAPSTTPVRIKPPSPGGFTGPSPGEPTALPEPAGHAVTLMGVTAPAPAPAESEPAADPSESAPRRTEITSTLVSPGTATLDAPVAVTPEPEALIVTVPVTAPLELPERVQISSPVRDEKTEPLPMPANGFAPLDALELEAQEALEVTSDAHPSEPIGPLPPARPPTPSRAHGRPPHPSPVAAPAPALAEEAPAAAPAPPAAAPAPAPPASVPVVMPSSPPRAPLSSGSLDPDFIVGRRRPPVPVPVPMSSLFGAGGVLIGMVIAAFFVGRASAARMPRLTAHPSLGALPALARAAVPPPPKPCWMAKQPAMWAPRVSRSIPFDAVATAAGGLAVGYARDAKVAIGVEVNLGTGEVQSRFEDKGDEEIERVVPTPAAEFAVARAGGPGALRSPIEVPVAGAGGASFAVGLDGASWALAAPPGGPAAPLWPLPGDDKIAAASVHPAGAKGYALTFRRGSGAILGGWIGADRKASGELVAVAGSGGSVGKPTAAWNGRELAVIFADRPEKGGHYEIRIGHAAGGVVPATTTVLPLPSGGPGGDAFAPDIAGLPDGRWLLMWTEGASGSRAVRAQTLAPDFTPLGDPIALSPPAGNFGQGVIGVAGGHAATIFLSKGASSYELWGAVLQCQ